MDFFIEAFSQPASTIALVSAICVLGIFAVMNNISHQILGLLLYPFSIMSSLCASQLFLNYHLYTHRAFDHWVLYTILSSAIGMAVATCLYILASRLVGMTQATPQTQDLNDIRVRRIQLESSAGK